MTVANSGPFVWRSGWQFHQIRPIWQWRWTVGVMAKLGNFAFLLNEFTFNQKQLVKYLIILINRKRNISVAWKVTFSVSCLFGDWRVKKEWWKRHWNWLTKKRCILLLSSALDRLSAKSTSCPSLDRWALKEICLKW